MVESQGKRQSQDEFLMARGRGVQSLTDSGNDILNGYIRRSYQGPVPRTHPSANRPGVREQQPSALGTPRRTANRGAWPAWFVVSESPVQ